MGYQEVYMVSRKGIKSDLEKALLILKEHKIRLSDDYARVMAIDTAKQDIATKDVFGKKIKISKGDALVCLASSERGWVTCIQAIFETNRYTYTRKELKLLKTLAVVFIESIAHNLDELQKLVETEKCSLEEFVKIY